MGIFSSLGVIRAVVPGKAVSGPETSLIRLPDARMVVKCTADRDRPHPAG
jgi:hypothetical protein